MRQVFAALISLLPYVPISHNSSAEERLRLEIYFEFEIKTVFAIQYSPSRYDDVNSVDSRQDSGLGIKFPQLLFHGVGSIESNADTPHHLQF